MRELTVAEQRYHAVLAVISDGWSISQVAERVGVSRQTLHAWLARYEAQVPEGLVDRSHRPLRCPHQMRARRSSQWNGSLNRSELEVQFLEAPEQKGAVPFEPTIACRTVLGF
jgi:transposase